MQRILRSTRSATAIVLALAGLGLLAPGAGAVPPTVSGVTVNPDGALTRPVVREEATYSVTVNWGLEPGARTVAMNVDGAPVITRTVGSGPASADYSIRYEHPTAQTISVSVTATRAVDPAPIPPLPASESGTGPAASVTINRRPVASFAFNPAAPLIGQDVLFASRSTDPDRDGLTYSWSFGDGTSSPGGAVTHPYSSIGPKRVTLVVTDSWGATGQATADVNVAAPPAPPTAPTPVNAAPSAAFAYSPRLPVAGEQVEFASSASDPEGQLREQLWDLDGDGQFDDARGDEVLYTFSKAGQKTVRLRVVDAAGKAAVRERTLAVTAAPRARAGFLSPFPVVRLNGEVRRRGAMVRLLSVKAPRGSRVHVRCTGETCKVKKRTQTVRKERVRFKAFERAFRAGTELEIFVRKQGRIGKYTKFAIRAGDAPERTDRCLPPGAKRPRRCGGS